MPMTLSAQGKTLAPIWENPTNSRFQLTYNESFSICPDNVKGNLFRSYGNKEIPSTKKTTLRVSSNWGELFSFVLFMSKQTAPPRLERPADETMDYCSTVSWWTIERRWGTKSNYHCRGQFTRKALRSGPQIPGSSSDLSAAVGEPSPRTTYVALSRTR